MNSFLTVFAIVCAVVVAVADDPITDAQAKCRELEKMDVESEGTAFQNNGCLLTCNIHGKLSQHELSEGLPCPQESHKECRGGQCLPSVTMGWIDIEMTSAHFEREAMAFADVCIQNSSNSVSLPIADRKECISCQTKTSSSTTDPKWDAICSGSHKFLWTDQSRVTFEVWDQPSAEDKTFVGGASLLIQQLLANDDSHKAIGLTLAAGNNPGRINVRVTWTPKTSLK